MLEIFTPPPVTYRGPPPSDSTPRTPVSLYQRPEDMRNLVVGAVLRGLGDGWMTVTGVDGQEASIPIEKGLVAVIRHVAEVKVTKRAGMVVPFLEKSYWLEILGHMWFVLHSDLVPWDQLFPRVRVPNPWFTVVEEHRLYPVPRDADHYPTGIPLHRDAYVRADADAKAMWRDLLLVAIPREPAAFLEGGVEARVFWCAVMRDYLATSPELATPGVRAFWAGQI